jgi:hypothetical protein
MVATLRRRSQTALVPSRFGLRVLAYRGFQRSLNAPAGGFYYAADPGAD